MVAFLSRARSRGKMQNSAMDVFAPDDRAPIGRRRLDARVIAERLATAAVGELIPYSELTQLVRLNVQGPGRSALESARSIAQRKGIVFGVILNVGLKRLTDEEIVDTGFTAEAHVRRHVKRAKRKLLVAEYEKLKPEKQSKRNAYLTSLSIHEFVASEKTMKRIEGAVTEKQSRLSLEQTIEMFKK